jgi:hypothetical protein
VVPGIPFAAIAVVMLAFPAPAMAAQTSGLVFMLCGGGAAAPGQRSRLPDCPGACHAACSRHSAEDDQIPDDDPPLN